MGYYFVLVSFPYFFSSLMIPVMFKYVPRKVQFVLCFFFTAFSLIFIGPSKFFGLPDEKYLIMIGLPILSFVQALSFIPSLPEAIDVI